MERLSFFATRTEEEAMRETHNEPHSVRPGIADSTSLCFCKGEDDIANDDNSIVFQGKVIRGITAKEREFIKQNAGGNIWKYKGSISAVEFKKLILIKDTLGHVYNVVDPVEVYGVLYPAYTNFVCINAGTDDEPVYKWDSFGGTYPEATDTVPGIISKNQVRACIPIATLENNGLLSKEEFATFMNKLDAADLLPYATKEDALPKKEVSTRYLLPVHMDIDNLPNMTEGQSVIGTRTVADVDIRKLNVATVTVSSPCYVYFYLLAYNKDQIAGSSPIPMPYVLRYEVSCDKYNNGTYYSDGASQKNAGGCYACILFEVTDEMIQAEGGSVELNFYARSSMYPTHTIDDLNQILKVSLELFNKYEYVKTQEYLEEHYYDKETADTRFIKAEERPTFATKEYVIKSYEENSTAYNNRSTANMLLVQNNKNLRNKHISEFGWRVDSDVQIPEGEFYLCAMENDSRIIGYSKEKLNLRNFINQNILFTFEEDIVFSEEATVNGFALIAEKVDDNIYPIPTQNYPNMRPSVNTNVTADKNVCMLVVNGNWKTTQMAPYHIKYYEYIKDIINDGRLFIAEYGVTEYDEIKKAFDDNFNVICKKDNTFYNLLNVSSTIISFSASNGTQLNNISVDNGSVWEYSVVPVENKNNKEVTTLTENDTNKYPSSKVVADYISRQGYAKQNDLEVVEGKVDVAEPIHDTPVTEEIITGYEYSQSGIVISPIKENITYYKKIVGEKYKTTEFFTKETTAISVTLYKKPDKLIGYFVCLNSEQTEGGAVPTAASLNYDINCYVPTQEGMTWTDWISKNKPAVNPTSGDYESLDFYDRINWENINYPVTIKIIPRAHMFTQYPIDEVGQTYHLILEAYYTEPYTEYTPVNTYITNNINPKIEDIKEELNKHQEWYGTQEEFDALTEYDENVKYYIYD